VLPIRTEMSSKFSFSRVVTSRAPNDSFEGYCSPREEPFRITTEKLKSYAAATVRGLTAWLLSSKAAAQL
jgi:hypothetical protein